MEPQVGLVSGKLEEKEYGYKPGSRVYAGPDWGWQTQESYQKTVKMRRGGAFFDFMSALGDPIKQSLAPLAQQLAPVAEAVSGVVQATPLVGPFTEALGTTTETLRQEAVQRGLDPRFGDVAVMAGEELVTAGLGKAVRAVDKVLPPPGGGPQLAMAGVSPSITPRFSGGKVDLSPQVMEITVDPKFRAPGMVQDVAQQPEFRGALDRRAAALDEVQSNIARREAQGKTAAKYKKELAGKGSTLDYDPNDPIVFEKNRYKVYDPLDPQRTAHQHHLFAKAQSYPFVEKMEELISKGVADEDDLVNMFAWADMLDVTMGNTRKNMLDAPGRAHIAAAPGSTELDKALNIHAILKEFSLEISGKQVREMVKDAKNATELMDTFNNYIVESVKPQKRVAQRIVEDFITRHRATLPKDQLSMFDDLVSKLGGRYKPR